MAALLGTKRLIWALLLALTLALGLFSYIAGRRYLGAVAAVEQALHVTRVITETLSLLKDEETAQRGFLLTGQSEFLEPYTLGRNELPARLRALRRLVQNSTGQLERLALLEVLIDQKHSFIERTLALRRAGALQEVVHTVASGHGKRLMDRIRQVMNEMGREEDRQLAQRSRTAALTQSYAIAGIGAASAIALAFLLASFLGMQRDAVFLRRAAEELAESEERFRVLAENASDLVCLQSGDGSLIYASPSSESLLGYSTQDMLTPSFQLALHPDDGANVAAMIARLRSGEVQREISVHRLRRKDGEFRWFETHFAAVRGPSGEFHHLQSNARDVTERRRDRDQLARQADELKTLSLRDALTGLYNRRGFLEIAGQLARVAERERRALALVFIDLDGLKGINDRLGHDCGDQAIAAAAQLLAATCRSADVVARLGGDEFVVLAVDMNAAKFSAFRARVEAALARFHSGVRTSFLLSFSMGVAYLDPHEPEPIDALLARADALMYADKRERRERRAEA